MALWRGEWMNDPLLQASDQQIWSQVFNSPPSAPPAAFVQLVNAGRSPSSEETLRDEGWKARGLPSCLVRACPGATALFFSPSPSSQFLSLPPLFVVHQRDATDIHRSISKIKRGAGFFFLLRSSRWCVLLTHLQCFLPKQLVFVVKSLIR